ncbi:MAG: GC-type dockerin domain-anchored protein [Planctomycetota bacterium]
MFRWVGALAVVAASCGVASGQGVVSGTVETSFQLTSPMASAITGRVSASNQEFEPVDLLELVPPGSVVTGLDVESARQTLRISSLQFPGVVPPSGAFIVCDVSYAAAIGGTPLIIGRLAELRSPPLNSVSPGSGGTLVVSGFVTDAVELDPIVLGTITDLPNAVLVPQLRISNGGLTTGGPQNPSQVIADDVVATLSMDVVVSYSPDCDGDGVADTEQIADDPSLDCDGNGVLDLCQLADDPLLDADMNGLIDGCELGVDPTLDCDGNGLYDAGELLTDPGVDCDGNLFIDACELDADATLDCDLDGVLDSCQIAVDPTLDCDENGLIDSCEIAANAMIDCNENGVLDRCDIADGTASDENRNNRPDSCDIADNPSLDCNGNGMFDYLEGPRPSLIVPDDAPTIADALAMLDCRGGEILLRDGFYSEGELVYDASGGELSIQAYDFECEHEGCDQTADHVIVEGSFSGLGRLYLTGLTLRALGNDAITVWAQERADSLSVSATGCKIEVRDAAFFFRGGPSNANLNLRSCQIDAGVVAEFEGARWARFDAQASELVATNSVLAGELSGEQEGDRISPPALSAFVRECLLISPRASSLSARTEGVLDPDPETGEGGGPVVDESFEAWGFFLDASTLSGLFEVPDEQRAFFVGRTSIVDSVVGDLDDGDRRFGSSGSVVHTPGQDGVVAVSVGNTGDNPFIYLADAMFVDEIGLDGIPHTGDEDLGLTVGSPLIDRVPGSGGQSGAGGPDTAIDVPAIPNINFEGNEVPWFGDVGYFEYIPPEPCSVADFTHTGATRPGDVGFGVPDGRHDLDDLGAYLHFWLGNDPFADLTSTGASLPGADGYLEPDQQTDLDDLGLFITLWLEGCA